MLQVAGLEHVARVRCTKGVHPLLLLPVSRQLGTRHWTPAWLQLGPAYQPRPVRVFLLVSHLEIRVAWPWELRGAAAAAGNETAKAGQARARASLAGLTLST